MRFLQQRQADMQRLQWQEREEMHLVQKWKKEQQLLSLRWYRLALMQMKKACSIYVGQAFFA